MKHGMYKSPEYRVWRDMKQRCLNPSCKWYFNYGGRGIKVCERWHDFRNFFEDMGSRPDGLTLDRTDSGGNYEPSNCRWTTYKEQANNRRIVFVQPRQYWFIAYDPNNLQFTHINACILGKLKQHKGWKFKRMDIQHIPIEKVQERSIPQKNVSTTKR